LGNMAGLPVLPRPLGFGARRFFGIRADARVLKKRKSPIPRSMPSSLLPHPRAFLILAPPHPPHPFLHSPSSSPSSPPQPPRPLRSPLP
jgi:hypothetical protein